MQERLTLWQKYERVTKSQIKSNKLRVVIISFILVVVVFVIIVFLNVNAKNNWIEESENYFLVVGENLSITSAMSYKKHIEEIGGAGELFSCNNNDLYCVIIFSYKNKNHAEKVQKTISEFLPHCYVICKKTKPIKQKTQNMIKNISGVITAIEFINDLYSESTNLLFAFEKGDMEYSEFSRRSVALMNDLQRAQSTILENDELSDFVRTSLMTLNFNIEQFIEKGIYGDKELLYFRKFCVSAMVQEIKTNEMLSKYG